MTTGEMVFYAGVALLGLTVLVGLIFFIRRPVYRPEDAAALPEDGRTAPLRSAYPTDPLTVRRETPAVEKEETLPRDEGTLPLVEETLPLDEGTLPLTEETVPLAEGTVPLAESTLPLAEETVPLDNGTVPLETGTVPLGGETAPLEEDSLSART